MMYMCLKKKWGRRTKGTVSCMLAGKSASSPRQVPYLRGVLTVISAGLDHLPGLSSYHAGGLQHGVVRERTEM